MQFGACFHLFSLGVYYESLVGMDALVSKGERQSLTPICISLCPGLNILTLTHSGSQLSLLVS